MNLEEWWTVPGWGVAFAMWALAAAAGLAIMLLSALVAWRARRRRAAPQR